ncbi:MAG TPA: acetate/propionate family kinase [Allosphingosinicella sp.]
MSGCIAVLNAGSSSIKCALFEAGGEEKLLFKGQIEQIGVSPRMRIVGADGAEAAAQSWDAEGFDHGAGTRALLQTLIELLEGRPVHAVGHRVVHGGTHFAAPTRIDPEVIEKLASLIPLAPLHQPHNLAPIEAIAQAAPQIPQVACFDTAFHQGQPPLAQQFGLPRKFTDSGVRRYGFHGLSYEYVASRLKEIAPELAEGRIVIAHLGNGASLCAVHEGRSVASTMGFTAVDGLVMGTRCGAIDPGVLLYLMDSHGMDARAIEKLIYKESGLLGVSGISSDMRTLRGSAEPAAAEAVALFVYRIVREIGSLAAALGGLDALVFTGGIGENDVATRAEVSAGCRWLGLELDEGRNRDGAGRISNDHSTLPAWVVPTNEERMIARHAAAVLEAS